MGPYFCQLIRDIPAPYWYPRLYMKSLESVKLPPTYWRVYSTMTGKLPMKTVRRYVSINGIRLATLIETPTYGYGKFLIGREILNKLNTILDGSRAIPCLAESIEETNI